MELASSELIFPSGSLPWKAVTSRLTGPIACMMEGKTLIGRVLRRCSAGLSGEMHAGQCHAQCWV